MKELNIPVETIDGAELAAALTIIMDKNGQFYLNAPVDNIPLCEMLLGMARRCLDKAERKVGADRRIVQASEAVLRDLERKNGSK